MSWLGKLADMAGNVPLMPMSAREIYNAGADVIGANDKGPAPPTPTAPKPTQIMLAPDGTPGEVPVERVGDAVKAGFTHGVVLVSPDGQEGTIPAANAHAAATAGFKIKQPTETRNASRDPWNPGAQVPVTDQAQRDIVAPARSAAITGVGRVALGAAGLAGGGEIEETPALTAADIPDFAAIKPVVTAPVRLAARAAERAVNDFPGVNAVRAAKGLMTSADEAAGLRIKIPGRDVGLGASAPPMTLPAEAFDTSAADKAITSNEAPGKAIPAPTVRRTPGQVAPEQVGASGEPFTRVSRAVQQTGESALPGGGVIQRRVKALPAAPEIPDVPATHQPQYAYRVRDVGEEGVPAGQNVPAHATTTLEDAQRIAPGRAEVTGKPQEIVKVPLTNPDNYTRIPREGQPDWIKFKKPVPESVVEPAVPQKAPKIEDVVKQAAGTPTLKPDVPIGQQPVSRSTPTLPAKAFGSTVAPEVSETTGARTVAPGKLPTAFAEEVGKTTGATGPKPGMTLRESIANPDAEAAETPKARLQRLYPDSGARQQVHILGEDFYEAAKNKPEVVKAATKLSGPDIANAAVNLGEDMSKTRIGSQKAAWVGGDQTKPQAMLSQLIKKGHTPEEIIVAAKKKPTLSQMANP
jgi:hypothetical protein